MPVLRSKDTARAHQCYQRVRAVLTNLREKTETSAKQEGTPFDPTTIELPTDREDPNFIDRSTCAMAVRYNLSVLEKAVPGPSTELRVAPFAAVKILPGPDSDPHNLTPPDVLEFTPIVWLRLSCGITTWQQEKSAGNIDAIDSLDERVSKLVPLPE